MIEPIQPNLGMIEDVRAVKVGNRWNVGWLRGAIALKNRPSPFVDPRVSTGLAVGRIC